MSAAKKAAEPTPAPEPAPSKLPGQDLTNEEYREYEFVVDNKVRVYRINNPVTLFMRPGGTTHRVLDIRGIVHCVPTVGERGCVLRWKGRDGSPAVSF